MIVSRCFPALVLSLLCFFPPFIYPFVTSVDSSFFLSSPFLFIPAFNSLSSFPSIRRPFFFPSFLFLSLAFFEFPSSRNPFFCLFPSCSSFLRGLLSLLLLFHPPIHILASDLAYFPSSFLSFLYSLSSLPSFRFIQPSFFLPFFFPPFHFSLPVPPPPPF